MYYLVSDDGTVLSRHELNNEGYSQDETRDHITDVNPYGPENLMSLNLVSDYRTMTRMKPL